MADDGPANRLTLLLSAFQDLLAEFPGMVAQRAAGDGTSQLQLRLSGPGTEVVTLEVGVDRARLTGRTGAEESHAGSARIEDSLSVDLSYGYAWNGVECDSAAELATLLAKHMRRRLKALGDIEPRN